MTQQPLTPKGIAAQLNRTEIIELLTNIPKAKWNTDQPTAKLRKILLRHSSHKAVKHIFAQ